MNAPVFDLLKDAKITVAKSTVAAGTSDQNTAVYDMKGFEAIYFIAKTGTLTDTGTISLDFYENTANSTSGGTAISGSTTSTLTGSSNNGDNKLLIVGRVRPTKRYCFATFNRGTANCVIEAIIAIQVGASDVPVTQTSDVVLSAVSAGN